MTFKISEEVRRTCHNSEQKNTWTGNIDLSLNDFIMWDGRDYRVIWGIKLTQLCWKITANYIHKYLLEWPDRPIRIEYSRELHCQTYSSLVFAWFIRYCTVFLQPLCSELDSGPSLLGLPVSRHDEPLMEAIGNPVKELREAVEMLNDTARERGRTQSHDQSIQELLTRVCGVRNVLLFVLRQTWQERFDM